MSIASPHSEQEIPRELSIEESRFRIACTEELKKYNAEAISREWTDEQGDKVYFRLAGDPAGGSSFQMEWNRVNPVTKEESLLFIEQPFSKWLPDEQLPDDEQPGELRVLRYTDMLPDDAEELASVGDAAVYEGRARADDLHTALRIISESSSLSENESIIPDSLGEVPHNEQIARFVRAMNKYESIHNGDTLAHQGSRTPGTRHS